MKPGVSGLNGRRWQVSLLDRIAWVLAAGVAAGVGRAAKDVWGTRLVGAATNPLVPLERTVGLVLEVAAVFLTLILIRSLIDALRTCRRTVGPTRAADGKRWRHLIGA
jgi:hypothetical protein